MRTTAGILIRSRLCSPPGQAGQGRSLRSRRRGDGASATLDSPALPGVFRQLSDEFLTDDEAAAYGRYAGVPSQEELDRMFFIDDADRALIARRRGDHTRLGLALQLTTVRYLGTFLPDPLDVPTAVLERLAGQLQIADPSCVKRYTERRTTPFEHREEIKAAYGLREFAEAEAELRTTLLWKAPFWVGGWSVITIVLNLVGSTALVMGKDQLPLSPTWNVPADTRPF
jgi:hypothetical protein